MACHDVDYQQEKHEHYDEVPIIEHNLPKNAPRELFGMAQLLEKVDRYMLPEKMEAHDIHEIKEDGDAVQHDINSVYDALRYLVDDFSGRETIINNEWQIERHDDRKVESHPLEIEAKRLSERQLMKKLKVEQID